MNLRCESAQGDSVVLDFRLKLEESDTCEQTNSLDSLKCVSDEKLFELREMSNQLE